MSEKREIWEYVGTHLMRVPTAIGRGGELVRQPATRPGQKFQVDPEARETYENLISDLSMSLFRSGGLRRLDKPEENPETAPSNQELEELFSKRGTGFQVSAKKLSDHGLRRLYQMAQDREITVTQDKFLSEYMRERFPSGGPTAAYKALEDARDVVVADSLE